METLASFVAILAARVARLPAAIDHGLDVAGRIIAAEARAEIGTYQPGVGDIEAWPELAPRTKRDKNAPPDDPLLRTGEMRDSISHEVESGARVVVGSTDHIAVFQELGTVKMPARSFLAGALVRKAEVAANAIGDEVVRTLIGDHRSGLGDYTSEP